jgi:hypothetical protein
MKRLGRKRKIGVKRQPNGQPSRVSDETERKAMEVVMQARQRIYGLTEEAAKRPESGSWIGRAYLSGDVTVSVSRNQLDAFTAFEQFMSAYRAVIKSPGRLRSGRSGASFLVGSDAEYEAHCERVVSRYDDLKAKLQSVDHMHRQKSLDLLDSVMRGYDVSRDIGALRLALNVVHRWAGLPDIIEHRELDTTSDTG